MLFLSDLQPKVHLQQIWLDQDPGGFDCVMHARNTSEFKCLQPAISVETEHCDVYEAATLDLVLFK